MQKPWTDYFIASPPIAPEFDEDLCIQQAIYIAYACRRAGAGPHKIMLV